MKNSTKKQADKRIDNGQLDLLLARLEIATSRLNAAAQEAGSRILALEERLAEAEPGITLWGATLLTESTTFQRDEGQAPEPAERVLTLGYARVKKDKWGIAVREVLKNASGVILSDSSSLLSKAERAVRLMAVPHLEALTRQVVENVEAQASALAHAAGDESAQEEPTRPMSESTSHAHN